jgi:hypothetical protein
VRGAVLLTTNNKTRRKTMMTVGEQRHMAVVEATLRRIADALERIANKIDNENKEGETK